MSYFALFFFILSLWNPLYILYLQHISVQISPISRAEWPHVGSGHHTGQCSYDLMVSHFLGLCTSPGEFLPLLQSATPCLFFKILLNIASRRKPSLTLWSAEMSTLCSTKSLSAFLYHYTSILFICLPHWGGFTMEPVKLNFQGPCLPYINTLQDLVFDFCTNSFIFFFLKSVRPHEIWINSHSAETELIKDLGLCLFSHCNPRPYTGLI